MSKVTEFKPDGTNHRNGKLATVTATTSQSQPHTKKSSKAFDPLVHEQRRQQMLQTRSALPIAEHRQAIIDAVLSNDTVILVGQTGSVRFARKNERQGEQRVGPSIRND